MRCLAYIFGLALYTLPVLGNVEKTIFIGPESIDNYILTQQPSLDALNLEILNPAEYFLRRQLNPAKPGSLKGSEAWFVLDRLKHKQRYEVRVCWAATVGSCLFTTKCL